MKKMRGREASGDSRNEPREGRVNNRESCERERTDIISAESVILPAASDLPWQAVGDSLDDP